MHVTCILNTYMCLKLNKQKINFRQRNLRTHKFYCFIKDQCTLSRGPDIEPVSCRILLMLCVCREGGCFDVVVFCNAIFFEVRAKTQIIFLPNKWNLEKYFHRQHILIPFFLFSFACECLPGIQTVYVVCGSIVLHD